MQDLVHIGNIVPAHAFEEFGINTQLQDLIVVELDVIKNRSILISRPKNAVSSKGNNTIGVGR